MFISGGARSGKSQFAEEAALKAYNNEMKTQQVGLYYIATARRVDAEMDERIRIHREERAKKWQTIEESDDILSVLLTFNKGDVILLDCLTIWMSQAMFERALTLEGMKEVVKKWLTVAIEKKFYLIIVSNDVNEGLLLENEAVMRYVYSLSHLHRLIVGYAEQAIQVSAGLPLYWKGEAK